MFEHQLFLHHLKVIVVCPVSLKHTVAILNTWTDTLLSLDGWQILQTHYKQLKVNLVSAEVWIIFSVFCYDLTPTSSQEWVFVHCMYAALLASRAATKTPQRAVSNKEPWKKGFLKHLVIRTYSELMCQFVSHFPNNTKKWSRWPKVWSRLKMWHVVTCLSVWSSGKHLNQYWTS